MKLTVYHDGQFWVAVLEKDAAKGLVVRRHVFGVEPKDGEVLAFVCSRKFDDWAAAEDNSVIGKVYQSQRRINPKRLQREVRKEAARQGIGTKAQLAMQQALEQQKLARHVVSREEREAKKAYKRAVAEAKAKAKRRGH